jgi:23S rRNA (pseudouridine1915-N3)-methyltransferase
MMKLRICAVGRKPAGWASEAERDFLQRLRHYADVTCELVAPEDEHSIGGAGCRERESDRLLAKCRPGEFVIALDRRGRSFSSEQLAGQLRDLQARGARLCCLIGGSHGLSDAVLAKAGLALSFSRQTFPHELFRIMLLEQLYRGFTILAGKTYHK